MNWRSWVIAAVILILASALVYAVSVYGGNKVDQYLKLH